MTRSVTSVSAPKPKIINESASRRWGFPWNVASRRVAVVEITNSKD